MHRSDMQAMDSWVLALLRMHARLVWTCYVRRLSERGSTKMVEVQP